MEDILTTNMKKRIIIIGGGVAGLSAGIYAQLNGFESTILEKGGQPGGLCTAWERNGYRFDYSIQWIVGTRSGVFNDIYKETHILTEEVKVINPRYHTLSHLSSGREFIIHTNIEEWRDYLIANAPEDEKAIRKMCRHMNWCKKLQPFDAPPPLRSPFDYLKALCRSFWTLITILRFKHMSCQEYFDKLDIKSPWIQEGLISGYKNGNYSIIAFLLMLSWYTQKNAGYPIGGSMGVNRRMEKRYKDLGGNIRYMQSATEILCENGKATGVLLSSGERVMADYVVSAADGHSTLYEMLKGKFLCKRLEHAYKNWKPYPSIVQISIGVNDVLKTDFPIQMTLCKKRVGETRINHNYRVINYSFDHTFAPAGKTSIIVRFESPFSVWESMTQEEYAEEKKRIAQAGKEIIERHYPGASEKIEVIDVATPLTTFRYTGAWKGSCQGFNPTRENISQQLPQTIPGLSNFYMAGQWLFPGGGIPPSTQSGKWAVQLICKKEKLKFRSHE